MEEKFKPGDLVQLKSGGPVMTIQHINSDGCFCRWFDAANLLQHATLPIETLKLYEETKPGKMSW